MVCRLVIGLTKYTFSNQFVIFLHQTPELPSIEENVLTG